VAAVLRRDHRAAPDDSPDPVLARHAGNLALISGPSGLRPDLDVAQGAPIATTLACMIAYDGVTRTEHSRFRR
jgi:hypothetical protein